MKITKNNLILPIVLLILLFFVFFDGSFSNKNDRSPLITIKITDEGFSPNKIVISPGTKVVWVNDGDRLHWPASNFHPTHDLYPLGGGCIGSSFDACKGLQKGESYSFQFDVLGKWAVHDHLFPGLLMTVEVSNDLDSANSSINLNKNIKVAEFRTFDYAKQLDFIQMLSKDDPALAWDYLKEAFIINGQVVGNAHEFSHIIGNLAYKKYGLNGIKICDSTFAFGCFHGVSEAMLLKEGTKRIKDIELGCLEVFPPSLTQDYTGCIHGTGHGVFTWNNGDLNKSLFDCDIISEAYRSYCYDGVFMENSTQPKNIVIDINNPWKLCSSLDERYHRNCARYQSQIFLSYFHKEKSLAVVGKYCTKGPSTLLRETCFHSLGFYVAQMALGKVENIWNRCNEVLDSEGASICITGAAIETVFQRYGDFSNSSRALCNRLNNSKKTTCLDSVNQMLK